jgi:hypothetical protein
MLSIMPIICGEGKTMVSSQRGKSMKRLFKATVRGVSKAIGGVFFVFFPPDTDVPPSYYREETQDHSEYLPGIPGRSMIRSRHVWRPPIVEQKPPVED